MAKYYEVHKNLILAITLVGLYFPAIEKIYGEKDHIKAMKFLGFVSGGSITVYFLSFIKYEIFDEDERGNKLFGYALILYCVFVSFTFYSYYYYRHDFEKLFELWDSLFQEELFPENRQELLRKNLNVTHKWLKGFGIESIVSCVAYFSVIYFIPTKTLNHPSPFPYRHQSPDFELMNTYDFVTASFGFSGLVVFEVLIMTFLSMEEAQLQHLKRSLGWIVDSVSVTDYGEIQIKSAAIKGSSPDEEELKKTFAETERLTKVWISHHQQVLRFHSEFQKVYSAPLSARFTFFVLIICLLCLLSLSNTFTVYEIGFSVLICSNLYSLFYVNVMYADSIAEVGDTIFGEAFGKSWHLYPNNLKIMFRIIEMRSNRPLHYVAFKKYTLCSHSFLKVFSTAYSLFTFMLHTNRKKIKTLQLLTSPHP